LIDGPPQVVLLAINFHEHLIKVPFIARPGPTSSQFVGKGLSKLLTPLADCFVGNADSTDQHQLFDITITEAEAKVEPHTVTDNLGREAMASV
jgi:hypothetical protein